MRKNIFFITLFLGLGGLLYFDRPLYAEYGVCQSEAYSAVPPFVSKKVQPNVMFMLDNSGSMKYPLYYRDGDECKKSPSYDDSKEAFGLFDDTTYKYDPNIPVAPDAFSNKDGGYYDVAVTGSVRGAFIEDGKCTPGKNEEEEFKNCWDGKYLNWLTTRRIDTARQVLTGGKIEFASGYSYLEDSIEFSDTTYDKDATYYKIVGNNEPADHILCSTTHATNTYGPIPTNTGVTVYSPAMDGLVRPGYDPYAKISVTIPADKSNWLIKNDDEEVIGQFGFISDIKEKKNIQFGREYDTPPRIILGPIKGTDRTDKRNKVVMRAAHVSKTGFSVIPNFGWVKNDSPSSTAASIFYMVIEDGTHLVNNKKIIAGNLLAGTPSDEDINKNIAEGKGEISYKANFKQAPVAFSTIIGHENVAPAVSRVVRNPEKERFDVSLVKADGSLLKDASVSLDYIVLEEGLIETKGGYTLKVDKGFADDSYKTFKIYNRNIPENLRVVAAATQTSAEADPFVVRYDALNKNSVKLSLDERGEGRHAQEELAYILAIKGKVQEYNIALVPSKPRTGLFADFGEDVRQGASFYKLSSSDQGIYRGSSRDGGTSIISIPTNPFVNKPTHFRDVKTFVGADASALSDAIQHMPLVWGTTPLAENFYEVIRYFSQGDPYYKPSNASEKPSHYVRKMNCTSDDENCHDEWDPYYLADLKVSASCMPGYVIILTDGAPAKDENVPNEDFGFSEGDKKNKKILDKLSLWANSNDLRDEESSHFLPEQQSLTTYTVGFSLGETVPQLLKDTAAAGGGKAYSASNARDLKDSLESAINEILNAASSGSGVGAVSENRSSSGFLLTQSTFHRSKVIDTNTTVNWQGALHSYWFYNRAGFSYIKEDTEDADYLNQEKDNIIEFDVSSGTLQIPYFESNDKGEKGLKLGTHSLESVPTVWDAGKHLLDGRKEEANPATFDPASITVARRLIYTVGKDGVLKELTTDNKNKGEFSFAISDDHYDSCLGSNATTRADNLISYIRGAKDDFRPTDKDGKLIIETDAEGNTINNGRACRNRAVVPLNGRIAKPEEIWKLADMTYSTGKTISYPEHNVTFIGTNDGMLHAFNAGHFTKKGVSGDQILQLTNSKTDTSTNYLGKELWAFIPKNAMPYLQYLADPEMDHIYGVDGTPYFYELKGATKAENKIILIMGMRFGGATATSKTAEKAGKILTPDGGKVGLSSYFALDITDPYNPIFLWEFSHEGLGLSYSGPSIITRKDKSTGKDKISVVFLSGPTNAREGTSSQDFKIFILPMDEYFKTDTENPIIKETGLTNSFGGRLYNNGLDLDRDGYTDVIVYGVANGRGDFAKGRLRALATTDKSPKRWEEKDLLETENPIVSSVVSASCFDDDFVYFGTGRWFFPEDTMGRKNDENEVKDVNALYGLSMKSCTDALAAGDECLAGFPLDKKYVQNATTSCTIPTGAGTANYAWKITADMLPRGNYKAGESIMCGSDSSGCSEYSKERLTTDPTVSDFNVAFFTTNQPNTDVCSLGGRTRVWALNCRTGGSIFNECEDSKYKIDEDLVFNLLLQLSGGDMNQITDGSFGLGGLNTDWFTGIPPEGGPTLLPTDSSDLEGELLLWQEQ